MVWWHLVEMLDLGVLFWKLDGMLDELAASGKPVEQVGQSELHLRLLAHRIRTEREGWALFTAGLNIPPTTVLAHMPGYSTLRELDEAVATTAFSSAEPENLPEGVTRAVPTAEGVAAGLRQAFDHLAAQWA